MKNAYSSDKIILDGEHLTLEQVVAVARHYAPVEIAKLAKERVQQCRKWIDQIVQGKLTDETGNELTIYGINTGFGILAKTKISRDQLQQLQHNLIVSHCAGVGNLLPVEIVRAMMVLRANTLLKGHSGIRLSVIDLLIDMLNHRIHPAIPEKGSVGASGDLAPLSHLALALMGVEGGNVILEEDDHGRITKTGDARQALENAGLKPVTLKAKEGLALNNGTQMSTAIAALAVYDAEMLVKHAEIAGAMTLEAVCGMSRAFDARVHALRHFAGQSITAQNIRKLTDGSSLVDLYPQKVQDGYSIRCMPQVIGAVRDTIAHVRRTLEVELNAATDNPLIFPDDPHSNKAFSAGNFHGEPVALVMDFLGIALAELGSISERRIFRLTDANLNEGLSQMLVEDSGLENGYMIAQYTAAGLVSENKSLAHPASVDSVPTSANQEDHVSMSAIAARQAWSILKNAQTIIAIELLCATQALDLRLRSIATAEMGKGTKIVHQLLREHVPFWDTDRIMAFDIETALNLLRTNAILTRVSDKIGGLG
ncbi:MAG: histidine ammonia-lyase [Gemmatimonadetes bacterium]|nr:MAG: histidine ammonia-lyase [Gemmatimonadota bacterium]